MTGEGNPRNPIAEAMIICSGFITENYEWGMQPNWVPQNL